MRNGDYINKLVQGVRGEVVRPEKKEAGKPLQVISSESESSNINELLEAMRNFEVRGDSKRLIRIDSRTEEILKLLNPTFRVDVTSFVNFLCWEFLENNPELINEIKQNINKL